MAAALTAFITIETINTLYRTCDTIIEDHDVYKVYVLETRDFYRTEKVFVLQVETVADSYLVRIH